MYNYYPLVEVKIFLLIKIEKYHYFLKYLKRYPQYGGQLFSLIEITESVTRNI